MVRLVGAVRGEVALWGLFAAHFLEETVELENPCQRPRGQLIQLDALLLLEAADDKVRILAGGRGGDALEIVHALQTVVLLCFKLFIVVLDLTQHIIAPCGRFAHLHLFARTPHLFIQPLGHFHQACMSLEKIKWSGHNEVMAKVDAQLGEEEGVVLFTRLPICIKCLGHHRDEHVHHHNDSKEDVDNHDHSSRHLDVVEAPNVLFATTKHCDEEIGGPRGVSRQILTAVQLFVELGVQRYGEGDEQDAEK
mmetsp:Transcript_47780/g.102079  ORF Transcript_47780/g.102079 Transcript_47780/m.102079 type:complete len:251 (+) Transcript_47780:433-1185(+)